MFEALENYLKALKNLGVTPPIFIMLSLLGVKGYTMRGYYSYHSNPIQHENLLLPEILVENIEKPAYKILRPAFDIIWQSAGIKSCPYYDDEGNYDSEKLRRF